MEDTKPPEEQIGGKKAPRKPRPSELAAKAAKKKPKAAKPKAKKPAKRKPAAKKSKVKKKTGGKSVERAERLDFRLSKAEKARIVAKAKKSRRTVTSILLEAVEKVK